MADEEYPAERHLQRRGRDQLNPIQRSKWELQIRLVFPPYFLQGITERPAKNLDYTLQIGKKKLYGKTDPNGVLRKSLPVQPKTATLTIHRNTRSGKTDWWTLHLVIGDLQPVDAPSITGIKARLNNLGLFCSTDLDEESPPRFWRSIQRFNSTFGVSDQPSPAPLPAAGRIKDVYGS
jgi:hypothetical protein